MNNQLKETAILGAGLCGLGMAARLQQEKLPYDQFEKMPDLGGNWRYGVYESVHIISSKKTTEYPEYPMPADYPNFPSYRQMLAYLENYAAHFNLKENIQFNSEILSIEPEEDKWRIRFANRPDAIYKRVVVCNGHHWHRRFPSYPGKFTGEVIHSKNYKTEEQIRGKRVLVVGAGNSALDIAVEAGRVSDLAEISMRKGRWIIPKSIMGVPTVDVIQPWMPAWLTKILAHGIIKLQAGDATRYGMPDPGQNLFEHHPTVNSQFMYSLEHGDVSIRPEIDRFKNKQVFFKDGTYGEYDMIVYATGFHVSFPMLKSLGFKYNKHGMPDIVKGMFPKDHKGLYILGGVGQPRYGAGPLVSAAADLLVNLFKIEKSMPEPFGRTMMRMGVGPLEKEALDPFEVLRATAGLKRITGFLPMISSFLKELPLNPADLEYEVRKNYTLPPPGTAALQVKSNARYAKQVA